MAAISVSEKEDNPGVLEKISINLKQYKTTSKNSVLGYADVHVLIQIPNLIYAFNFESHLKMQNQQLLTTFLDNFLKF